MSAIGAKVTGCRPGMPKGQRNWPLDHYYVPEPNTGCWLWFGTWDSAGYGTVTRHINGRLRKRAAHRVIWEERNGPIPKGLFLCHRCDTKCCVNPDHFFLGTHRANMLDMVGKRRHRLSRRTHCKNGHEYTPENTIMRTDERNGSVWRDCRSCNSWTGRNKRKARYGNNDICRIASVESIGRELERRIERALAAGGSVAFSVDETRWLLMRVCIPTNTSSPSIQQDRNV